MNGQTSKEQEVMTRMDDVLGKYGFVCRNYGFDSNDFVHPERRVWVKVTRTIPYSIHDPIVAECEGHKAWNSVGLREVIEAVLGA